MSATLAKRLDGAERVAMTANRLRDGAVVWRRADGGWSIHFHEAAVFPPDAAPAALAEARRDEAARLVVGVYATPVVTTDSGPSPASWKERIRAAGPTIAVPGGLHGQA